MTQRHSTPTLYRLRDHSGRLLYVGISDHPVRRLREHERYKEWWRAVTSVNFESHETMKDAAVAERKAIRLEKPLFNIQHADAEPLSQLFEFGDEATACENSPVDNAGLLTLVVDGRVRVIHDIQVIAHLGKAVEAVLADEEDGHHQIPDAMRTKFRDLMVKCAGIVSSTYG